MNQPRTDSPGHSPGDQALPWASTRTQQAIALLAALFVALHHDILYRLGLFAWTDGDWSHAFLVPLISLYFIHQQRDRIAAATLAPAWSALPLLVVGVVAYGTAVVVGVNDTLKAYIMIGELAALVALTTGWAVLRHLWMPIVYLVFAVKLPAGLWEQVAWAMQLAAAHAAVALLNLIGAEAHVARTTIDLFRDGQFIGALNVAKACSGMRMLITFIALGVAMAYIWHRAVWARFILIASTIPIAIVVNVARVAALGLLYRVDPKYATGDFHVFLGMVLLVPAMGLLLAAAAVVGWCERSGHAPSEESATETGHA